MKKHIENLSLMVNQINGNYFIEEMEFDNNGRVKVLIRILDEPVRKVGLWQRIVNWIVK
jgi:hypothetical protein